MICCLLREVQCKHAVINDTKLKQSVSVMQGKLIKWQEPNTQEQECSSNSCDLFPSDA